MTRPWVPRVVQSPHTRRWRAAVRRRARQLVAQLGARQAALRLGVPLTDLLWLCARWQRPTHAVIMRVVGGLLALDAEARARRESRR